MVDPTPDELLIAVLTGNLSRDDPSVQDQARNNPEFEMQLSQLIELSAGLSASAELEREVLKQAQNIDASSLDSYLEAAVDGELQSPHSRSQQPAPSKQPYLPMLVAAAVLLALGFLFRDTLGLLSAPAEPLRFLGQDSNVTPKGPVPGFGQFTWDLERTPIGWFSLEIKNADGAVLLFIDDIPEQYWSPTKAQLEILGDRISWRVNAHEPQSDPGEDGAEAWLLQGTEK